MIQALKRQDILNCINSETLSFKYKSQLVYRYQKESNPLFGEYLRKIRKWDFEPNDLEDFAFLPISFFKSHEIKSSSWDATKVFKSSGTTSDVLRSKHFIRNIDDYHRNALHIWESYFGFLESFELLTLLPNYHENPDSSLLNMLFHFSTKTKSTEALSYLFDQSKLYSHIEQNIKLGVPTILFGVRFALYEYAKKFVHRNARQLIIVETGGMKKQNEELSNQEINYALSACFHRATLVGEYGMTECFSQLYDPDQKGFMMNDRMRAVISDVTDPFYNFSGEGRGRINLIDLANLDTISFIATDDLGHLNVNNRLEILGRLDNCDIRGCNHLIS